MRFRRSEFDLPTDLYVFPSIARILPLVRFAGIEVVDPASADGQVVRSETSASTVGAASDRGSRKVRPRSHGRRGQSMHDVAAAAADATVAALLVRFPQLAASEGTTTTSLSSFVSGIGELFKTPLAHFTYTHDVHGHPQIET